MRHLSFLLLTSLALAGCHQGPPLAQGQYTGVVELHERNLGFELPGKLLTRDVQRGDAVSQNQPLAKLDDTLEQKQLAIRQAELEATQAQVSLLKAGARLQDVKAAQAQVRAAKALEDTLQETVSRDRKLRAANALPQARLDEEEGQLQRATADRQAAEQRVASLMAGARSQEVKAALARAAQAQAALDAESERIARMTLRAPVAGEILETAAEPGEVLPAGAPVVTLGEPARPYVDVFVPEPELPGLSVGTRATVRVDGASRTFEGRIQSIGRVLEFTPRYLFSPKERPNLVMRVRVDVADPDRALHAGTPTFVDFARTEAAR